MSAPTSVSSIEGVRSGVPRRPVNLHWETVLTVIFLLIGAAVMIAPFAWIMQVAFSSSARAYQLPPQFIPSSVTLQNFENVFKDVPYLNFMRNSLFIASAITIGQL